MALKVNLYADSVQASSPLFGLVDDVCIGSPFAVAPDGQRFPAPIPVDTEARQLEAIINWPARLTKGAGLE